VELDWATLKRWAAEFEERMGCSGKTNGPIKVEDFRPDSKVVLFSFKKILFVSITNLVYKSRDVTVTDWVADSGASNHITSSALRPRFRRGKWTKLVRELGNLSSYQP
jgi:hypothetical protein